MIVLKCPIPGILNDGSSNEEVKTTWVPFRTIIIKITKASTHEEQVKVALKSAPLYEHQSHKGMAEYAQC